MAIVQTRIIAASPVYSVHLFNVRELANLQLPVAKQLLQLVVSLHFQLL